MATPLPSTSTGTPTGAVGPNRGGDLFVRTQNGNDRINFYLDIRRTRSFRGSQWGQERTYRIEPQGPQTQNGTLLRTVLPQVNNMFEALMEDINERQDGTDMARLYINHPILQRAIVLRPRPLETLTPRVIMDQVAKVLHSEENIPLDGDLDINIGVVRKITGGGISSRAYILDYEKDRKTKRSVLTVPIEENDNFCLAKAIIIANAHHTACQAVSETERKILLSKASNLRRPAGSNRLKQETESLMKACGVSNTRLGSLEDIFFYEEYFQKSICVLSALENNGIVYSGSKQFDPNQKLYLYHWKPFLSEICHFDVITNIAAFMGKATFCQRCDKVMTQSQGEKHSCEFWCTVCQSKECLLKENQDYFCGDCKITCRSKECFKRHKEKKSKNGVSLCDKKYKCLMCNSIIYDQKRPRKFHKCNENFCSNCQVWVSNSTENAPHRCHMRSTSKASMFIPQRFIFFDFESTQSEGIHIPNLVVAHSACTYCKDEKNVENSFCNFCGNRCKKCNHWNFKEKRFEKKPCDNNQCGRREVIFRETDVTVKFGDWVVDRQHRGCVFLAHNAKAYDNYFLLNYFLQKNITPKIIFDGSKAVYMSVGKGLNIRFLDSCMFLPMALSELPKCFDLKELKKGYFPHFFNRPENYNKKFSNLPPVEDYGISTMSQEKKDVFLQWYESNKNNTFDFEEEMLQYCRSDVDILRQACLCYRELLLKITAKDIKDYQSTGVDPFSFVSAASVCMGVFQSRFLSERWRVAPKSELDPDCPHDLDTCKCHWYLADKKDGDSKFVLQDKTKRDHFSEFEVNQMVKQFLDSSIGLLNPSEYRPKDNYSLEAMEWIKVCEKELNETFLLLDYPSVKIQTALSDEGEKIVSVPAFHNLPPAKLKLDGYYFDPILESHVALEFYGCHWHGCPECYKDGLRRTKTLCRLKTMQQRFEQTFIREERLKKEGYVIKSIWACEFSKQLLKEVCFSAEGLRYVKDVHISLRDCYFGGRTAATKMYHNFSASSKKSIVGKYVDFTSLYPWALKYGVFPIGHPKRYTLKQIDEKFLEGVIKNVQCTNDNNKLVSVTRHCPASIHTHVFLNFFGIAKVFIIPPKSLLHPVLPYRCQDGKLLFPLCAKCGESNNQNECNCSDKDRGWVGTFCSNELEVAIEMGYNVKQFYEILHWENTSDNLFSKYVNCFLQIKQEASGFPSNVVTPNQIENYVEKYKSVEGIELITENIKKSSALRSLAKLMLNSLYGKFGQRTTMRNSHLVSTVEQLCTLVGDPCKTLIDFHVLSENMMHLETEENRHFAQTNSKTNVTVSAFTTAWARLKLWSVMHKLGKNLLYTDTDSLIYISHPAQSNVQLGNFLGDLSDELVCKKIGCKSDKNCEHFILEFVAGGPKNYAYRLNSGETVCKIRGFTLDCTISLRLNFSVLKAQVFDWLEKECNKRGEVTCKEYLRVISENNSSNVTTDVSVVRTQITRNKRNFQIYNHPASKKYSVVLDKNRVILFDLSSVPFGFCVKTEKA